MFSEMLILKQKIMRNLFLVLFSLSTITCIGSDLYVFPGATLPNYPNIQLAMDNASSGDNIIVATASYSGDVVIDKSITITAMTDNYTIQGGILLNLNSTGNWVVNIKNVDLLGNLSIVGGNNDNTVYELNIIDSSITGNVSLAYSSVTVNAYFSEFSGFSVFNSRHIISNIFSPSQYNAQTIYFHTLNTPFGNNSNGSTENPILKIVNNKFNNTGLYLYPETYNNELVPKIIIANNYFDGSTLDPTQGRKMIEYNNSYGNLDVFNNTFKYGDISNTITYYCSSFSNGGFIIKSSAIVNEIRNNLFFVPNSCGQDNSTSFMFSNSQVLVFKNNSNNHGQSDQLGVGYLPSSSIIEDNYWNSGANVLDLNEYGGMFSSIDNIDMGSQEVLYRDIDNTINDLGTWGGPYSYENYNKSTLLGKAQIFDLEIPSSIYALPGVNVNIKAKGIISN